MKTIAAIRPIKEQVEAELLKRAGVTGVDIGYKYTGGKRTEDLAIRVYVAEKKTVAEKERLPKTLKGIQTDVIERTFVLHTLRRPREEIVLMSDTGTYDPIVGGISIGPCRSIWLEPPEVPSAGWYIFGGTLGAVVKDRDTGAAMFLSNFHVMCVDDAWSVGDTMAQPSQLDTGSCPGDIVGSLQRAQLGGTVDCAVCSHTARAYSCEIADIGDVEGTATATLGMTVRKRGRTTGLTHGTVDTTDLSVNINYGDGLGNVVLNHQIGVDVNPMLSAQFGDHGDSGSVVVDSSRKVIGLHFAGNSSGTYGVANPIQDVLDALNINMCVPKLIEKKWELKEFEKKLELKEHIEKKLELKEHHWEYKDPKEIYELAPKEIAEIGPKEVAEGGQFVPVEPGRPMEGRLSQLEATVQNLSGIGTQAGAMQCIDFSTYGWMVTPNPWTIGSVQFLALDHAGAGWPNPGVKNYGGLMGLDCGFRLQISYAEPCRTVQMTLAHFSQPAKAEAFNTDGSLAGTATMTAAGGVPETLTFNGSIRQVVVTAPQNETLLLKLCCEPESEHAMKDMDKSTAVDKSMKVEKNQKTEVKELKDKPEKWELPEYKTKNEKMEQKEIEKLVREKEFTEKDKSLAEGMPPGTTGRTSTSTTDDRLTRIETAIAQLTHFITPESRPDLSAGALRNEPNKTQR